MLNIICGKSGVGKTKYITDIIHNINDLTNVLLIIPDQESFEYEKRLYNALGAEKFNNFKIFTFTKLAKIIIDEYGDLKQYADDTTKLLLMNSALKSIKSDNAFYFYNKQYNKSSFIRQSLEMLKELQWSGISVEELNKFSDKENIGILSDKLKDIAEISSRYNQILSEKQLRDIWNNFAEATKYISKNQIFAEKVILIDGFNNFSFDEYLFMEAIIKNSTDSYITLTNSKNSDSDIYMASNKTLNKLIKSFPNSKVYYSENYKRYDNEEIPFILDNVFLNNSAKTNSEGNITLTSAPDIYREVEFVAAKIRNLIIEKNAHYSEIAVIANDLDDYKSILESAFSKYQIEYFIDKKSNVLNKSVVIFILSVLDMLIFKYPDTETIIKILKTGFIKIKSDDNETSHRINDYDISQFENFCYKWDINKATWNEDFPDADNEKNIDKFNKIRQAVLVPISKMKSELSNANKPIFKNFCISLLDYMNSTVIPIYSDLKLSSKDKTAEEFKSERETKQILNSIMHILTVLYETVGDDHVSAKEFREIFTLLLSDINIQNPPQSLDSVLISEFFKANLNEPKYLFIIGANEGRFPSTSSNDSLISEREKLILKNQGIDFNQTMEQKISDGRFKAYLAMAAPKSQLYISYHKVDISGKKVYPSYLFNKISDLYENAPLHDFYDYSMDFYCSTYQAAYYNYIQQYNKNSSYTVSLHSYLNEDESEYKDKITYLDNLKFTGKNTDKIKDKKVIEKLFFRDNKLTLSASRFEDFYKCRFKYFCKKGINLYPLKKMDFDPMQRGNLAHKCFAEILEVFTKTDFINLSENDLRELIKKILTEFYEKNLGGDFGKTERIKRIYEMYSETILQVLINIQGEFKYSQFTPDAFELQIPTENVTGPLKLTSKNKIDIELQGAVDRVDICTLSDQKYIRIIDYKTGNIDFNWSNVYHGINMQMLFYLFALIDGVSARYEGYTPAGVFYLPSGMIDCSLSRNPTENDIITLKNSTYKMKGIILNNISIAEAMEEGVCGRYIPATLVKSGKAFNSSATNPISINQFKNLKKFCYDKLITMADELFEGNISANPISSSKKICANCEYRTICGDIKISSYDSNASKLMKEILDSPIEEEVNDNE